MAAQLLTSDQVKVARIIFCLKTAELPQNEWIVKARGLKSAAAVDFRVLLFIISGKFVNKKSKCKEKIRFQQVV